MGQIHFGPAGHISLMEALLFCSWRPNFFMPLRQLAIHYHDRAAALGAADAILTLLEQNDEAGDVGCTEGSFSDVSSLIEFNNISKSYGQRQLLSAINCTLPPVKKLPWLVNQALGKRHC